MGNLFSNQAPNWDAREAAVPTLKLGHLPLLRYWRVFIGGLWLKHHLVRNFFCNWVKSWATSFAGIPILLLCNWVENWGTIALLIDANKPKICVIDFLWGHEDNSLVVFTQSASPIPVHLIILFVLTSLDMLLLLSTKLFFINQRVLNPLTQTKMWACSAAILPLQGAAKVVGAYFLVYI